MPKFRVLLTAFAFTLIGLSSASARQYVDAEKGIDSGTCPVTAPCATLNFALSQVGAGFNETIVIVKAGNFGPIYLTGNVFIVGADPNAQVQIYADSTALVGCIGAAPGSCGANNGYAVEIAAGVNDVLGFSHVLLDASHHGVPGVGALKFTSGGKIQLSDSMFHGNATATGPLVLLNPNNAGTTQAQVYFSNSDVGFNNSGANAGAVLVQPQGNTSMELHFNHVQVHNASYGIRTDGSSLSGPSGVVATFVSESEFFSFNNAAVNAFSTAGTGTVNAIFKDCDILNASVALKANGPQSFVVLTRNTVGGNGTGVQVLNGATVLTSLDNTITGNGPSNNQNVSGTLTAAPLQ
jgi:hypothetical protein